MLVFNKSNRVFAVKDNGEIVKILPNRTIELSEKTAKNLIDRYKEFELIKSSRSSKRKASEEKDTIED